MTRPAEGRRDHPCRCRTLRSEPLIDRLFTDVYSRAFELGMMLSISSNGSRLANPAILDLLTTRPPYRLTISVYGASAESYDGLTRRRGSFAKFSRGLAAAHEAGLPLNLNLIRARAVLSARGQVSPTPTRAA